MDYEKLAEDLLDLRAKMPRIKMERRMDEHMRGEIFALDFLASSETEVHPKDISRTLSLTSARIAAILNSLEKQGYLTRNPDPSDSRQLIIRLTEAGREVALEHRGDMIKRMAFMLEALGEEDAKNYVRIQKKLVTIGQLWQ